MLHVELYDYGLYGRREKTTSKLTNIDKLKWQKDTGFHNVHFSWR